MNSFQNYEIISILSQEIFGIVEDLNLIPLSELLQKTIKSFHLQLNKFLLFQYHYFRHIKSRKEADNSLVNIVSYAEIQNLDMFTSNPSLNLVNLTNNNNKNLNKMEDSLKKSFSTVFKNFKNRVFNQKQKENSEEIEVKHQEIEEKFAEIGGKLDLEQEETQRKIDGEREMADMNNILDGREKRLEEINMIEARNIAAHSELIEVRNDIKKNKNSQLIYTGENLDFLIENEKLNKNNSIMETENDDLLRIPYFSKNKTTVLKQSINVKKMKREQNKNHKGIEEEDEEENEKDKRKEGNIVSSSHKSRLKVAQHDLKASQMKKSLMKNKGTEVFAFFANFFAFFEFLRFLQIFCIFLRFSRFLHFFYVFSFKHFKIKARS